MQYRRLVANDIHAVADFAIQGMRPHLYPGVRLSEAKIVELVRHFQQSESDFHVAAFKDGKPVGIVAAAVVESPFFERAEAHVVALRATARGVGDQLLTALVEWVSDNPRVRRALFHCEFDAPPSMRRLMRRYGFAHQSATCTYYKD